MVRRPRAGIDLDNVLYEWESYARYLLRTWWNLDLPVSTDYDSIQRACGPERWAALFDAGVRQLGLFSDGNIIVDAAQVLPELASTHDLVVLTRRPRTAIRDTHEWLSRHLIHPSEVVILHGDSSRTKSDVPCDWYVDDSPAEVEDYAAHGKRAYLLDRPWNKGCEAGTRVKNWHDLLDKVFAHERGDHDGL